METRTMCLNLRVPLFFVSIVVLASSALFLSFELLYNGARKPLHPLTFDVLPSDPVAMIIHNTHRYQVASSGAEEFAALLPPGGHLVHLGSPPEPYTPTLFHQMKCLGIIHASLVDVPPDSAATSTPLISHCLNYLRQMVLCQLNLRLESVMNADAGSEKEYETVCRNWEMVYAAAEQNQQTFAELHNL